MHIKKLEIDNFKSFAGKVEIPFLTGFTAVAGPNGSGKSNIIDSILFALGLTSSTKALRTEKGVADLISTHNQRNEASVKVVFDLDDNQGGEISFTRKVKKATQGYQSTYYIDDKPQTLGQVHLELEKHQITPNSYNVIMQGDVLSLVSCTSVERRKFIDEVAGTADFDRKIENAMNDLKTVEDRIQNSNIILEDASLRVEELKSERETAIKYRSLKEEKDSLEGQISAVKYFNFKKILDMVHQNILDAVKNQKSKEKEVEEFNKNIELQTKEYEEICAKVKAQGEEKQLEVKKKAEEKKASKTMKQDSIKRTNQLIYQNNKTIENKKNGIEKQNLQKETYFEAIKEKEIEKTKLEDKLKEQKLELDKILKEQAGLNETADVYLQKRATLRKELDSKKEEENNILKEKYPLESRLEVLNNELKSAKAAKESILSKQKTFLDDKDKKELFISKLQKELDEYKTLQRLTFESLEKVNNELDDTMHNIQLANQKIVSLEANRNAYKTYSGHGVGVDTVLRSNLKGVHSTLSELADVEAEYVEAINQAIGGRANHIVVDNEHVASQAIQILKSQGQGRAYFIPLNKIKPAPSKLPLPKEKGVIDYAINLIDFDDIYTDAFYYALGDTLVADNMETAKKLMGKYRIVTLDGEIFEKSGIIAGGAKSKNQPLFGKMEDKELETYKNRFKELQDKYAEMKERKISLEKKLEKIREDNSNAMNSLQGVKIELNLLITNNSKSEELLAENEKKIKDCEPEIKSINTKLDKLEEKHFLISGEITKLNDDIVEVEKFIDDGALNKLKELTKGIEDAIKQTEKEIADVDNEIYRTNNSIKFADSTLELLKGDIERLEADNSGLNADNEKYNSQIKILDEEIKILDEEIEELGKNLVELQTFRKNIEDKLLKSKSDKNIIENEIERIKEQIESAKARRSEVEPQFKEVSDELKEKGVKLDEIPPVEMTVEDITKKIQRLQNKMDELGLVNMRAVEDYEKALNKKNELEEKITTLENEKTEILNRMTGYESLKKETFMNTFNAVNKHFGEIFTELTDGSATLILEDELNPFNGGLTIEGQQRDKKKQKLVSMSGGEKTLMALSLVFAVQRHLPAPFYALDEVDAALDGFNVERIAKMIRKQSDKIQFVVISQRSQMIDSSDRIIGVTQKQKGVTQISGVTNKKNEEREVLAV